MNRIPDLPKNKEVAICAHTHTGDFFKTFERFANIEFALNFLQRNALSNRVYQICDVENNELISAYLE